MASSLYLLFVFLLPVIVIQDYLDSSNGWTVYDGTNPPINGQWVWWWDNDICISSWSMSTNGCVILKGDAYISRIIPTTGYHTIGFSFDIRAYGLESTENCYIMYRSSATESWNDLYRLNSNTLLFDRYISVPDNDIYNNQSTFEVKLGTQADAGNDNCVFDEFIMHGIAYTNSPTSSTTPNPSPDPSSPPSLHPSNIPTIDPTNEPSKSPSKSPSESPTKPPSEAPTISPYVYCQQSQECHCKDTSECIFMCIESAQCAGTTLSTAYNGQDIVIYCWGTSACFALSGDSSLSNANSVTWHCAGHDACANAYLQSCGFQCELNCDCGLNLFGTADCPISDRPCGDNYLERINRNQAFTCNGHFCITPNPTASPTLRPSDSPIADGDPTRAPSDDTPSPSKSPSNIPTMYPSLIPSTAPVIFKSTYSTSPTFNPITTTEISMSGSMESSSTTMYTSSIILQIGDGDSFISEMLSNTPLLGAIITILAISCCICILVIFLCCRYHQSKRNIDKSVNKNEGIEMNDTSHSPKNVNISSEISTEDHMEDVVIKVKTGVASENHEGVGHVKAFMPRIINVNQRQMKGSEMELKQNMFEIHSPPQISIKDIFSFTSDRELGNDEEKIADEDIMGNHRTRGNTDTIADDDYQPPYMMDNMIMDDPIDEFDYFQNDRYEYGDEPAIIQGVTTADIDYAIDDE